MAKKLMLALALVIVAAAVGFHGVVHAQTSTLSASTTGTTSSTVSGTTGVSVTAISSTPGITVTPGVTATPGVPNTGAGGNALDNILLLGGSALVVILGVAYLVKATRA